MSNGLLQLLSSFSVCGPRGELFVGLGKVGFEDIVRLNYGGDVVSESNSVILIFLSLEPKLLCNLILELSEIGISMAYLIEVSFNFGFSQV